jgi:uncharacterized protein (DUF305 family)
MDTSDPAPPAPGDPDPAEPGPGDPDLAPDDPAPGDVDLADPGAGDPVLGDADLAGRAPDEPALGESDGDDAPAGLSWGRVAVLGLALAFLGFAVGFVATRDRPPGASSADVGFLQDMLTHHDQALQVATLTDAYGEDPVVRSYAREVLTFQSYEIGVMTQMLAEWGYTRDERSDEAMAWMGMAVPVERMPGLLTDDQLDEVREARGPELDGLFLELMAEHHRGGLHMAQEGAALADDDGVAELAARIGRNQAGEINEYRVLAEEMGLDIEIDPPAVPPADLPPDDG